MRGLLDSGGVKARIGGQASPLLGMGREEVREAGEYERGRRHAAGENVQQDEQLVLPGSWLTVLQLDALQDRIDDVAPGRFLLACVQVLIEILRNAIPTSLASLRVLVV